MSQPAFWLKVNKNYIFDNFNNLLDYLKKYNYVDADSNTDYDDTLQSMNELADDIIEEIMARPLYEVWSPSPSADKVVRLFCAIILGDRKRGVVNHRAINGLITVLSRIEDFAINEHLDKFFRLAQGCIPGEGLKTIGFSWSDLEDGKFTLSLLSLRLKSLELEEAGVEKVRFYYENKGIAVLEPGSRMRIAPMNYATFAKSKDRDLKKQYCLSDAVDVLVKSKDYIKVKDFDSLYRATSQLIELQSIVSPSPEQKLKAYMPNDEIVVRITRVQNCFVLAESIDPAYEKLQGKVLYRPQMNRPGLQVFTGSLKAGDYITVQRTENPGFTFDVTDTFERVYREWSNLLANTPVVARYYGTYPKGNLWITTDGIVIGVEHDIARKAGKGIYEDYLEAVETGNPINLTLYSEPRDISVEKFFCYACLNRYSAVMADVDKYTVESAERCIVKDYVANVLEDAKEIALKSDSYMVYEMDSADLFTFAAIIYRMLESDIPSINERLRYTSVLEMLCVMLDRPKDKDTLRSKRHYMAQVADFVQNKPMRTFKDTSVIDNDSDVAEERKILDVLRTYKKRNEATEVPLIGNNILRNIYKPSRENILADVTKLVEASNSLVNIIDDIELNKIKEIIARKLKAEDEYESILENRTFYGMENIALEFKTSIVFPPTGKRRFQSEIANPEIQKWAILKAICGFMNTRNGGVLLLGVNDNGYANGLDSDIAELFRRNEITARTLDSYRSYVQYKIDSAFRIEGKNTLSQDITRSHIDYQMDENAEGDTILKITVRPYADGIVSFKADSGARPEDVRDSYVRLSGQTVPITPELEKEVLKYKK